MYCVEPGPGNVKRAWEDTDLTTHFTPKARHGILSWTPLGGVPHETDFSRLDGRRVAGGHNRH
jgi:hypothetical protein